MKDNVLLVVNPISGNRDKKPIIDCVENTVKKEQLTVYKTSGNNDSSEIQKLCKSKNIKRILIAGGDGTIKLIAEATKDLKVVLGIIPGGSSNGFATDLGLYDDIEKAVKTTLGSKTRKIDVLQIDQKICLHICDLGLNAELIQEYDGSILRGKVGYILQSIPTLIKSEIPFQFTIEVNNETYERTAIMIAVANSKKFGTGAVVNPNSKLDDGVFEILIFKSLNILEIFKTLTENSTPDKDFLEIIPCKSVVIKSKQEINFQIDGEAYGKRKEVKVEILPQHIEVAVN